MPDNLDEVYDLIARRLGRGKVIPVLGAGVNLCERPPDVQWQRGSRYLPSGQELAQELARDVPHQFPDGFDLARVAQYLAASEGAGPLYQELHELFDADYPPTLLHHFLARLSRQTRTDGARECMVFLTTNYDELLEKAFQSLDEPYDLVTYIAEGRDRGLFRHSPFDGSPTIIRVPNEYTEIRLDQRAVIAKIHGAVDRVGGLDSYVITEDHYIDYITRADVGSLFPVMLAAKLKTSHFLFLGYSLRDWNFRVMLYRLSGQQEGMTFKHWAMQPRPDPIDRVAWDERGVDIIPARIDEFVDAIERRLNHEKPVSP
jgi:SIR2-like protein